MWHPGTGEGDAVPGAHIARQRHAPCRAIPPRRRRRRSRRTRATPGRAGAPRATPRRGPPRTRRAGAPALGIHHRRDHHGRRVDSGCHPSRRRDHRGAGADARRAAEVGVADDRHRADGDVVEAWGRSGGPRRRVEGRRDARAQGGRRAVRVMASGLRPRRRGSAALTLSVRPLPRSSRSRPARPRPAATTSADSGRMHAGSPRRCTFGRSQRVGPRGHRPLARAHPPPRSLEG